MNPEVKKELQECRTNIKVSVQQTISFAVKIHREQESTHFIAMELTGLTGPGSAEADVLLALSGSYPGMSKGRFHFGE